VENERQLEALRRKYRSKWDAHQLIAYRNAHLVRAGRQPTNEQLLDEQQAADAMALVRGELLLAMSRGA
jgi:hypothetical protein